MTSISLLVEAAPLSLVPPPVLVEPTLRFGLANSKNATQLSRMTRAIPGQGKEREAAQHRSQRTIKPQSMLLSRACGPLPLSASASNGATSFQQGGTIKILQNRLMLYSLFDVRSPSFGPGSRGMDVNLSHRNNRVRPPK